MTIKSISAGDFVQLEVPPRQNIISPFLPERGLAEIYAKTGVGKTTFALSLAIAASTGKHFFEWEVRRPWKVLYIDGEMSTHEMQKRLTSAAEYFSEDPAQLSNLRLICRDREDAGLPDIGSEKGQDWFSEDIEQAELVFLDNISCLWWSGKENDADAWWCQLGKYIARSVYGHASVFSSDRFGRTVFSSVPPSVPDLSTLSSVAELIPSTVVLHV